MEYSIPHTELPTSWFLEALSTRGLSAKSICERFDIPSRALELEGVPLPVATYNQIFEWAALELGDHALGLHIAEASEHSQFGLFGYIANNASTLRDWTEYVELYHSVFTAQFSLRFTHLGEICRFEYDEGYLNQCMPVQDIDLSLALIVATIRNATTKDWTPDACYFKFPPPKYLEEHRRCFGDTLYFNQAVNALEFPEAILATRIHSADPRLLEIMMSQANSILDEMDDEEDIVNQVRSILAANLGARNMSSVSVAHHLNMSSRGLNRRLKVHGTSYHELRDDIVLDSAKRALLETDASITDIALAIGYAETSSFVRGFRRLVGHSPRKFRDLAGEPYATNK